jgi:O-antigen/teichoic acid export membrane protein
MSTIRKQSILSSGVVYLGLALGAFTQYLFAREFRPDQYGLINGMFMSIGTILCFTASFGMPNFIYKFDPYYRDNLPPKKNDIMSVALLVGLGGFLVTSVAGVLLRGVVIRFYAVQSAALVHYYYWIFLFGLGLTLFAILEAYGWQERLSVLTSYLREVQVRLFTIVLIVLYLTGVLGGFDLFAKLFAFNYLLIALILLIIMKRSGKLHLAMPPSRVTRKFAPKIRSLAFLAWGGNVLFNLSFYFAQLVIAGLVVGGLTAVGVFTLAQNIGSLIQAPQRAVGAAALGPLARAWKDKDYGRIGRIYHRSSINQLLFSAGMFVLVWINYRDAINAFHLNPAYLAGQSAFLFIGLARVVDLGTGVNSQVIGTSIHWRFELFSGIILMALTIPLNYILAKRMGLIGPAIADLVTFFIYNAIRWFFLYRKYKLQPFDRKTVQALLLAGGIFFVCDRLFSAVHGLVWMFVRSAVFIVLYATGVLALRLSEDVLPVWRTVLKRIGLGKSGI